MPLTPMGPGRTKLWTRKNTFAIAAGVAVAFGVAACYAYRTVNRGTLGSEPADAVVVFGSPTDISGALTDMQRWRVDEGVAEYRRGRAPVLLFTGGPAANKYVESQTMAQYARSLGVPSRNILTETQSTTTVENIRNITPMLLNRGWSHVELVSSAEHLPRIAVLMRSTPFVWRLHAAQTPGRASLSKGISTAEEASVTLVLRTFGSAAEPIVHATAVCVHWIVFVPKYLVYELRRALRST